MFEIRVAVIGYVSVGKTTVINALLGDEYGEVSMKRTTAVVNSFRIFSSNDETFVKKEMEEDLSSEDDSIEVVTKKLSASATLKETTTDNAKYRSKNIVKEKTFDITLKDPLVKMRPDTHLVVVDIPGINEAGTSSKYKDFVNSNWHTFDVVVVVMDARQGVNTEEQHDLLKLVKDNLSSRKAVPVIILGNKVDDPDDKEQVALLGEARSAVEKLFEVTDREKALQTLLRSSNGKKQVGRKQAFPAVVPISAMHAFVYRCGSHLSFDEFCKMDREFIERIGKDSYGRQWHRFGKKKQMEKAFEAVSEEEQRQDGLNASNFDTFVKVLAYCIGDNKTQEAMIESQINESIERMKTPEQTSNLGADLLSASTKLKGLGKSVDHLPAAFWSSYKYLKKNSFDEFKGSFMAKDFDGPMSQLVNYFNALETLGWPGEADEVVKACKELTLQYAIEAVNSETFKNKSPCDQTLVIGSMLLGADGTFNKHFGFLKLYLESKKNQDDPSFDFCKKCQSCQGQTTSNYSSYGNGTEYCTNCGIVWIEKGVSICPSCTYSGHSPHYLAHSRNAYGNDIARCNQHCGRTFRVWRPLRFGQLQMKVENGQIVPENNDDYKKVATIVVPDSLEDPNHFGHLIWKSCQLLRDASI